MFIKQNRSTSEDLLINAGICPQKRKRKRQLFNFNQPLKSVMSKTGSKTSKSSYATPSSQPDRYDLLPENQATSHRLQIKKTQQLIINEDEIIKNDLSKIDSQSEPDLSSHNKPNIPLPSPTVPINVDGDGNINNNNTNNNNTNNNHNRSSSNGTYSNSSPNTPKNSSLPVPLTSALPSPKQIIVSSQRAKSQPPIYTEQESNNGHNSNINYHQPQRSNSLNSQSLNKTMINGGGKLINNNNNNNNNNNDTDSEAEQKANDAKVTPMTPIRRKSDSDVSRMAKNLSDDELIDGNDDKHKNGLTIITNLDNMKENKFTLPKNVLSDQTCDYPFDFVECIINVLSQCSKLSVFTIRVLSELLIDFVQDRTMKNNGLNDKHYNSLLSVWNSVKSQLNQYLPLQSAAMETYFIDTFEEEWRSVRQQPRIETLVANPIRILPPHVFHGTSSSSNNNTSNTNNNNNNNQKNKNRVKSGTKKKSDGDKSDSQPSNSQSGKYLYLCFSNTISPILMCVLCLRK